MFRRKKDPDLTPRQALFFAVEQPGHNLSKVLADCTDPTYRAVLLEALACIEHATGVLHQATFGPDPMDDEGGRDLADSHKLSARLLRRMAEAEAAYAEGRQRRKPRRWRRDPLERAAGRCLDALANRSFERPSSQLLDALYLAVEPVIGGQAAEAIQADLYGPQPDLGTQQQYKAVA